MFQALPCLSSGVLRRNCIYAVLYAIILDNSLLQSDDTRDCIYIQLRRRPPEDEQGNARNM
jgi:hypothetical protein